MDLQLDHRKGSTFNCSDCNPGLMKVRNCTGDGERGKNLVNGNLYPRCPRAISFDSTQAEFLVSLYSEAR